MAPSCCITSIQLSRLHVSSWARSSSATKALTASLSTTPSTIPRPAPTHRCHIIFGANTDVGKSLVSAGLVRASLQNASSSIVNYMKPLQCGGSDQAFVEKHVEDDANANLQTQTLFSWETPASPHIASIKENFPKSDKEVLDAVQSALTDISSDSKSSSTTWIETAGGVLSPSSASPLNQSPTHAVTNGWGWTTQGDLYRPLSELAPVVLVGDGRLGGISATLSAMESLVLRGYNVMGMVVLETGYDNISALRDYYGSRQERLRSKDGSVLFLDPNASIVSLPEIPPFPEPLHDWYESEEVTETLASFDNFLATSWAEQVDKIDEQSQQN